ncbi:MAG: hypothetical protein PHN78_08110 [Dehalococcoidales bacterium]|nr:hypothetical protein [Dehalococcoidales bacterium]
MRKTLLLLLTLGLVSLGCSTQQPNIDRIKVDLIGQTLVHSGVPVWEFAALSEYEQFDIVKEHRVENAIEYDVSMGLIDLASQTHYSASAIIVYKINNGKWEIISIVTKTFEEVPDVQTF